MQIYKSSGYKEPEQWSLTEPVTELSTLILFKRLIKPKNAKATASLLSIIFESISKHKDGVSSRILCNKKVLYVPPPVTKTVCILY